MKMNIDKQQVDRVLNRLRSREISPEEARRQLLLLREPRRREIKVQTPAARVDVEDIAVIGMSGRFPGAGDIYRYWQNLAGGVDSVTEVSKERWDPDRFYDPNPNAPGKTYCKWGGLVADIDKFDPLFFNITPREAEFMDPQQRLFLQEAWRALEDAGYAPDSLSGQKCGVFVGAGQGDYRMGQQGSSGYDSLFMMGTNLAFLAARIAYFLNLVGPCLTIDTACSSSLVAIHQGCKSIIDGESQLVLAGGVSILTTPYLHISTSKGEMLSRVGKCQTFDNSADGFVLSDGVGVVVLKALDRALRDNDHIYGVIKGALVNQDGKTNGITAPSANSQMRLEMDVYHRFHINPEDIGYVEAHGTGTKLGDPIEIAALTRAFRQFTPQKQYCPIGSVKTNIGHTLAAAGVASLIKVLLCLKHKKLAPSLHFHRANEHIDFKNSPFYVNTGYTDWQVPNGKPRLSLVSSFGLSGTNCHMLVGEAPPRAAAPGVGTLPAYLIPLAAKGEDRLNEKIASLSHWLEHHDHGVSLGDMAYTLQVGRTHFPVRAALIVGDPGQLKRRLKEIINTRDNDFYRSNKKKKPGSPLENRSYILPTPGETDYPQKLAALAELYVNGHDPAWIDLYRDISFRRIPLPTYPFAGERCWFEVSDGLNAAAEPGPGPIARQSVPTAAGPMNSRETLAAVTLDYLTETLSALIKVDKDKLDPAANFEEFGLDSILITQLNRILGEQLGEIPATLFFTYKNLESLAQYFVDNHESRLQEIFSGTAAREDSSESRQPHVETNMPGMAVKVEPSDRGDSDIAVIGISGQYPMAADLEQYWENLKTGRDCISEIPSERWDYRKYYDARKGGRKGMYCYWGGFLEDIDKFDPLFFNISPLEARFMDPQERLFLQCAWSCCEDAGYTRQLLEDPRVGDRRGAVGVFAGVTFNNYQLFALKELEKGKFIPINSQTFSVANRVSYIFNLRGPSVSVDTACSSSLYAIHMACKSLQRGECDMALAGGVNLSLHPSKYITICAGQFGASDGRCRAFGAEGDGYVPGEGVGVVLLKPLHRAIEDNDHIYALIKSTAVNHDGKTFGYTVPNPVAQAEVIDLAIKKAGIDPRTITYLEAHGTGTSLGDPIEIQGLSEAYGKYTNDKQFCAIGSVKSNIGHAEAAAGIAQLTKVVLQMQHKTLVPSLLHADHTNPNIDFRQTPFYVQLRSEEWKGPRRAGISSFGAGGVNVHLIMDEYIPQTPGQQTAAPGPGTYPVIIPLSAKKPENLVQYARRLGQYLERAGDRENHPGQLAHLAYTLQTCREPFAYRLALLAHTPAQAVDILNHYLEGKTHNCLYTGQAAPDSQNQGVKKIQLPASTTELVGKGQKDVLAELWVKGAEIEWQELYPGYRPCRVPAPTYPFSKERYWVTENTDGIDLQAQEQTVEQEPGTLSGLAEAPPGERSDILCRHLQKRVGELLDFKPPNLPGLHEGFFDLGMDSVTAVNLHALLQEDLAVELHATAIFDYPSVMRLSDFIMECISLTGGEIAREERAPETSAPVTEEYENIYYAPVWEAVDPASNLATAGTAGLTGRLLLFAADQGIYRALERRNIQPVLVTPGDAFRRLSEREFQVDPAREEDYAQLFQNLAQQDMMPEAVIHAWSAESFPGDRAVLERQLIHGFYSLFFFSRALLQRGLQGVVRLVYLYPGGRHIQPVYEAVSGFARSAGWENPGLMLQTAALDFLPVPGDETAQDRVADLALNQLSDPGEPGQAVRYENDRRLVKSFKELVPGGPTPFRLEDLLKDKGVYLVIGGAGGLGLLFVQYLAQKVNGIFVLSGRSPLKPAAQKEIHRIRDAGAEVVYLQADVSEPQQAEYLVSETRRRFGKINGMIHAAGVLRDSFIIKKNRAEIDAVLAAKVFGTFYLDKALGNEDLDFFVLFSSLASTMGNAGQCDYAYANYFLDSFARLRDRLCREGRRRGRTLSINWPPWRSGGMKIDANVEKVGFKKLGLALLETGEGFEAFDKALAADMPQVALVKAKRSIITRILNLQPPQEPAAPGNEISAAIMALDTEQAAEELETVLEKLGI